MREREFQRKLNRLPMRVGENESLGRVGVQYDCIKGKAVFGYPDYCVGMKYTYSVVLWHEHEKINKFRITYKYLHTFYFI